MPSLRRSFSSPSVRSSPYPSVANSSSARTRQSLRRPSASATAQRRVLADIEWWRVYDGQCDPDLHLFAHQAVHELDPDVPPGGSVTLSAGGGSLDLPQTHSFLDSMQYVQPDVLAALSIVPYSPPSRHGRDSSVESTPELPTAPLETVQPGLPSLVPCPFSDLGPFPSTLRVGSRQVHPLFGLRSISAPGPSYQTSLAPGFADMGGEEFSLDQNLFQ